VTAAAAGGVRAKLALLSPQQRFLLMVLGATSFFDGYDRSILEIALPQIRESFDVTQSQASLWIAVLYLGALPALVLARRADSHGRRQLLLISVAGYTLATAATALAPSIELYTLFQFVARLFLIAESAVVWTLAAEELPAGARGLGFGILAMNSALGVGFGAILFGTLFDPLGLSWRWLYVASLPALFLVALLRRRLPESGRFTAARTDGALATSWRVILRRPHRRWLVLIAAATFFSELVTHASVFVLDFLQTDRGLTATDTSLMLIAAGLPGIPAMVVAGSLSDRYGRRLVGCTASIVSGVGAMAFFWLPGGIPVLLPAMSLMLVGSMGSHPVLNGYATELFPTSLRSQASSWAAIARVAGQAASLAAGAALLTTTGSMPMTTTILVSGALVAVVLYATLFPDTHGRELEDLEELSPPVVGALSAATGP
jgi:MFS family permease